MQAQMEAIRNKVNECIQKANKTYGIQMPAVDVRFDLTGRAAGMAMVRYGQYVVRFNVNHMRLGGQTWEHLLNDTVPHEVAHLVCYFQPQLGRAHNNGWKRVCLALGGNGQRCYSEEDAPEAHAALRPYVYTTTLGQKCPVTPVQHRKIQAGTTYTMRRGGGVINRQCQYEYMGNTVQAKPAQVPAQAQQKPVQRPAAPAAGASKADMVRARIAQAKARGEAPAVVVQWAVDCLGMTRSLASSYVKNNWPKVA